MAKFAVCLSAAAVEAIMSNVDQDGALLSHNRMCDILCFVFYILYFRFLAVHNSSIGDLVTD